MKKNCLLLFILLLMISLPSSILSEFPALNYLIEGKRALDLGNFSLAEKNFTNALPQLKEIGDYILFWRAKSYIGLGQYNEALMDLSEIKRNYPSSSILKDVRREEIKIFSKLNITDIERFYQTYINDYSEDLAVKFEFAQYLKEKGNLEKSKKLFKEIFLTSSSFADKAEKELSKEDITINDLIIKAKALNNAYMFKESEKYLKEALLRLKNQKNEEILSVLGYSLFMQKRYSESAEIFKKFGDNYWRGRSLLRARDFFTFEREMREYIKSADQRIGDLLINYSNIIRRTGDTEKAINLLKKVIELYPSYKEEALWYLGWTYYRTGQYDEAKKIFKELYSSYGKLKYIYWLEKANEGKGVFATKQYSLSFQPGDIYSYLLFLKEKITYIPEPLSLNNSNKNFPLRVELLSKAGFKEEALRELKSLIKNNKDNENIPFYSRILYNLGDYATSVRLISRFPNRFNYQELLYPQSYREIVTNVSKRFEIDPNLIFAIMREESRFDRFAISPAGAIGLMQLMPDTAKREGKRIGLKIQQAQELFDPEKNITIGTHYLKKLIEEFGYIAFAVAAYNAGENVVSLWIKNIDYNSIDEFIEDIPYGETRAYVQRVLVSYFEYQRINKTISPEKISQIIKIRGGKR
jgi:soluble lytic murein transglycosylase